MLRTAPPPGAPSTRPRRRRLLWCAVLAFSVGLAVTGPHPSASGLTAGVGLGPSAKITTSPGSNPALLKDGRPTPSRENVGQAWRAPARAGGWVQFGWTSVKKVTAVQIYGSAVGARVLSGVLTFDNGTSLEVGELLRSSAFPTVVAFRARSVKWVRFTVTRVEGTRHPRSCGDAGVPGRRDPAALRLARSEDGGRGSREPGLCSDHAP